MITLALNVASFLFLAFIGLLVLWVVSYAVAGMAEGSKLDAFLLMPIKRQYALWDERKPMWDLRRFVAGPQYMTELECLRANRALRKLHLDYRWERCGGKYD